MKRLAAIATFFALFTAGCSAPKGSNQGGISIVMPQVVGGPIVGLQSEKPVTFTIPDGTEGSDWNTVASVVVVHAGQVLTICNQDTTGDAAGIQHSLRSNTSALVDNSQTIALGSCLSYQPKSAYADTGDIYAATQSGTAHFHLVITP